MGAVGKSVLISKETYKRSKINMNITFIIGNGFDVGLGLRSKFSDYFPVYIDESKGKDETLSPLAKEIELNQEEWSYFEKKMGDYTDKFTKETMNNYKSQFKDFEVNFIKYLRNEESKLSYDKTKISQVFEKALLNFYKQDILSPGSTEAISNQFKRYNQDHRIFNFISFNYTDSLEKCLSVFPNGVIARRRINTSEYLDKIGTIVHIHGTKTNLPVMGVNDVSQIKNSELAADNKFAKYIVKPLNIKANRTNNDKVAIDLIKNSQIICIYGMSLGETDKRWWSNILKWLSDDGNRQLVIFVYDEQFTFTSQFDKLDKEDYFIDILNSYGVSEKIDAELLRDRIHIAIHKNIFSINLRREEDAVMAEVAATQT